MMPITLANVGEELMIYQFGCLFTGNVNAIGLIFALAVPAFMIYMPVRPAPCRRGHFEHSLYKI